MNNKITGILLLVLGTIFWGMTFAFTKNALNDIDTYSFLAFRFLIASSSLALLFLNRLKNIDFNVIYKGVILSIPLTIGFLTQTMGLEYTSASNGGFLTAISVIIVPIINTIYTKRFPSFKSTISILIASLGLLLITGTSVKTFNHGDLLMLICAIAFAFYIVQVSRESGKSDAILVTLIQLIVVSICSFFMAFLSDGIKIPSSTDSWTGILFCAIFATTFMYTIQNHYQQYLSTNTTVIILSLEPFFAAITAVIMLSEELTTSIFIGGFLIIFSMIMSEIKFKVKQ